MSLRLSPPRSSLVIGLALPLVAGCSSVLPPSAPVPAPTEQGSPSEEPFTEADVRQAVEDLAEIGVETRIRPSDASPITPVGSARSSVRLLRVQVRNMALEQASGSGTSGANLDAVSAAAAGGPVSALVAGWAEQQPTPAAAWAATLLGRNQPANAAEASFPTLALIAFVADATPIGASASGAGTLASFARAAPRLDLGAGTQATLAVTNSSAFCGEVSAYLSGALNEIVESDADPPAWLKQLIDLYTPQYATDLGLLRRTIGAIALLSYATSLARPWNVNLQADPASVAYGIEDGDAVQGDVVLTVSSGADVFVDDVADCAALAEAQLASVPIEGSSVVWDSSGLGGHAAEVTSTTTLDDIGSASLTFETATESKEAAENGDPATVRVGVSAWIDRGEMAALASVVKSILLGEAAGAPAGSTAKALYEAMAPTLTTVMRPSGFALIDVTYHTPKASPKPSVGPAQDITGTWVGTWTLNGMSEWGFTWVLAQTGNAVTGSGEVTGPTCVRGQAITGTIDGSRIHLVEQGERDIIVDGTVEGNSMSGTWTAISCGPPYAMPNTPIDGTWEATKVD